MRLQVALDFPGSIHHALALLTEIVDLVDIVEVGTPFIIQEGIRAVGAIKERYPDIAVLADLKIMDAGGPEAQIAFDAGADIVTVLGVAHDITIRDALEQAQNRRREIVVDLIGIDDVGKRVSELGKIGVDYFCVHTASDIQKQSGDRLRDLQIARRRHPGAKIAVAGGIRPDTLAHIAALRPDAVVVGSFITNHRHPRTATQEIRRMLA